MSTKLSSCGVAFLSLLLSSDAGAAPPTASANGSGKMEFLFEDEIPTQVHIAFSVKTAGGDTSGHASIQIISGSEKLHAVADLDCLRIVDGLAAISGVVVQSSEDEIEGATVVFAVRDGGQGNPSGDGVSSAVFFEGGDVSCETLIVPPRSLVSGNVQVSGSSPG